MEDFKIIYTQNGRTRSTIITAENKESAIRKFDDFFGGIDFENRYEIHEVSVIWKKR